DQKIHWSQEAATLCEGQLRDVEGAIRARRLLVSLDPGDETAADQLQKILEQAGRWDELAELIESRAAATDDVELKRSYEKQAAALHADKRQDYLAAGEAWARIANVASEDSAVKAAVELFERAGRGDRAAELIGSLLDSFGDDPARLELGQKLGELRMALG